MWMTQLQLCARRHSDGSTKVTQLHLTRHTLLSFPSFKSFFTPSCFRKHNVCLEAVLLWFCSLCHSWCTNCPFRKYIFSCHPSCVCLCLSRSVYWLTRSPFPLTSPGTTSMTNCPVVLRFVMLFTRSVSYQVENKVHHTACEAYCNGWHFKWGH